MRFILLVVITGLVNLAQGTYYTIKVTTSGIWYAGTNSDVYITIRGTKGSVNNELLDNFWTNDFGSGHDDTFDFTKDDVGDIRSVTMIITGGDTFLFTEVIVCKEISCIKFRNNDNIWLSDDPDEGEETVTMYVPCYAGDYMTDTGCKQCPTNTYSGAGAAECTPCDEDKEAPAGSTNEDGCIWAPCSAGDYLTEDGCVQCPSNTYSNAGAAECTECGEDQFSEAGSTSVTDCEWTICPGGTYDINSGCIQCPANTYSGKGAAQCTSCGTDKHSEPGSTSVTQCAWNWGEVTRGVWIDYDLENYPLYLRTDSETGSWDYVYLGLHTDQGSTINLNWRFYDYDYVFSYCSDTARTLENVPAESDKLWRVTKSSTALKLECNGVEVLNVVYADSSDPECEGKMNEDVLKIYFYSERDIGVQDVTAYDNASDTYLKAGATPQDCTALPWDNMLLKSPNTFPVAYSTRVTITCAEGHVLTGDGTVVCVEVSTYSYNTEPVCLSDCDALPPIWSNTQTSSLPVPFGSTITISCDVGYTSHGDDIITCQGNNEYSYVTLPSCDAPTPKPISKPTPKPTEDTGAQKQVNSTTIGISSFSAILFLILICIAALLIYRARRKNKHPPPPIVRLHDNNVIIENPANASGVLQSDRPAMLSPDNLYDDVNGIIDENYAEVYEKMENLDDNNDDEAYTKMASKPEVQPDLDMFADNENIYAEPDDFPSSTRHRSGKRD